MKMEDDPYVKSLRHKSGADLFDELLISRQRAKVVFVINQKAALIKMSTRKWMTLEFQQAEIDRSYKFIHQEIVYDAMNLKEPTRIK